MMNLTTAQVVALWSRLEQCYYNDDSYGGDECEIYEYTVLPRCPLADEFCNMKNGDFMGDVGRKANDEIAKNMWDDLTAIFTRFQTEKGCVLYIEDQPLHDTEWHGCRFHRIHIRVERETAKLLETEKLSAVIKSDDWHVYAEHMGIKLEYKRVDFTPERHPVFDFRVWHGGRYLYKGNKPSKAVNAFNAKLKEFRPDLAKE